MSNEPVERTPDNTVKDTKRSKCGCALIEFESGRQTYSPCPPCGLFQVAECLQLVTRSVRRNPLLFLFRRPASYIQRAALALASVATTLQQEQIRALRQQELAETILKAQKDTRRMDEEDLK